MIELLLLAFALSMDAFAVSIGLGAKEKQNLKLLALRAAIFFGSFQALMPLIGYLGGKGILGWIEDYAHIVAFALLFIIGGKMIYEGLSKSIEEDIVIVTNKVMLILAIATSIDAMAAGFSLTLLDVKPFLACLIIGLTTLIFSFAGVFIGNKSGVWLGKKAEIFGGVILIAIGIKILIF